MNDCALQGIPVFHSFLHAPFGDDKFYQQEQPYLLQFHPYKFLFYQVEQRCTLRHNWDDSIRDVKCPIYNQAFSFFMYHQSFIAENA